MFLMAHFIFISPFIFMPSSAQHFQMVAHKKPSINNGKDIRATSKEGLKIGAKIQIQMLQFREE